LGAEAINPFLKNKKFSKVIDQKIRIRGEKVWLWIFSAQNDDDS
jgi:hypothetical protein